MKRSILAILTALALFVVTPAFADVITLTTFNSTAQIDTASGMYDWTVNGTDHLYNQWFYYRIGSAGGEQGIDALGAMSWVQNSPGSATVTYGNPQAAGLWAQITYTLTGFGSRADIAESIVFGNTSGSAIDLHFFQYSDFDIGGNAINDYARFNNANKVSQSDPDFVLAETVVTPDPSHRQISTFPDILNSLLNGTPTTLADTAIGVTFGPGDMTWAFQWDQVVVNNDAMVISKDKLIAPVPEPATMALLGSGFLLVSRAARRKKS